MTAEVYEEAKIETIACYSKCKNYRFYLKKTINYEPLGGKKKTLIKI